MRASAPRPRWRAQFSRQAIGRRCRAWPSTSSASARSSRRGAVRSTSNSTRCNCRWARRARSPPRCESQIESIRESGRLPTEELALNEKLVAEGYVARARLLPLQRADADARSRLGESRGELALARQRAGELQARMADARNRYQQSATEELKQSSARLRELEERLRPSKDQVERQAIRSPVDGVVMGLRVTRTGRSAGRGRAHRRRGAEQRIAGGRGAHPPAGHQPRIRRRARQGAARGLRRAHHAACWPGRVTFVSPDRMSDAETGESWFAATVEVDAAALKHHPGDPAQGRHARRSCSSRLRIAPCSNTS